MQLTAPRHLGLHAEREVLTVRARNGCVAEKCRLWVRLLGRVDAPERPTVVLFGEVPPGGPGERAIAGDVAGLSAIRVRPRFGGVGQHPR